jgi:hypothetical protein
VLRWRIDIDREVMQHDPETCDHDPDDHKPLDHHLVEQRAGSVRGWTRRAGGLSRSFLVGSAFFPLAELH